MNYKKSFYKYHGLSECDVLPCAMCNSVAVNLHHVEYGKGIKDNNPKNLVPLCYACHWEHHNNNSPTTEQIKDNMLLTYTPF